jgi:hypothetical protein
MFRDEVFSCSLKVLYGGLGISKLHFLIQKILIFFSCKFFQIFGRVDKKCWIRIRIETNADLQHCSQQCILLT